MELILLIIIGIGLFILWIVALVDLVQTDIANSTDKLIWICIILFASFIGSILWFAWGKANTKMNR